MTAKEKAFNLITNFSYVEGFEVDDEQARKYALIAVDEILNAQSIVYGVHISNGTVFNQYWIEVKNEIENL